ncbi:hypothetical protein DFS34DRAFT_690570 [Phlyctochytrium arcticum]|nr:hypothetical protein DFS34DRAFT_690570 [Phlyctochytrium arcticum]
MTKSFWLTCAVLANTLTASVWGLPQSFLDTKLRKYEVHLLDISGIHNRFLDISAYGRPLRMILRPDHDMHVESNRGANLTNPLYFTGHLQGHEYDPVHFLRLNLINQGQGIQGIFELQATEGGNLYETYFFDTLDSHPSGLPHYVIYRNQDQHDRIDAPADQGHLKRILRRRRLEARQAKGGPGAGAGGGTCKIGLVADSSFAQTLGGPDGAQAHELMVGAVNGITGLYERTFGVKLVPIKTVVDNSDVLGLQDMGLNGQGVSNSLLQSFIKKLAAVKLTPQESCASILFTFRHMGNSLGVATSGPEDGICDPQTQTSVFTFRDPTTNQPRVSSDILNTIAHELGHSFGSLHDEDYPECKATAQQWIMAAHISKSTTFSECSIKAIREKMAKSPCLQS